MRLNRWTKELDAKLTSLWPTTPRDELLVAFEGYTYEALRKRAKRLGLKKTHGASDEPANEKEMLKRLEALGYQLHKHAPITDHIFNLERGRYTGEWVKIGVIGDTHLGSKHQQLTYLKQFYKLCADEGVKIVLHAGDISQGVNMFKGWESEAFLHSYDQQADYIVANYPNEPGITTYLILGNHDESFIKSGGGNICRYIANRRPDIVHIGDYGAYVELPGGMLAYLHHGAGGVAYSRSYKIQRAVENFSPGKKPKLYVSGHYHIACVLPDYRNCYSMHPGCFQGQGMFLRRLGVAPDIGGFIVHYQVNPNSDKMDLVRIKSEWVPFRKEMANDY